MPCLIIAALCVSCPLPCTQHNQFTGTLPAEWNYPNLHIFQVAGNRLTGPIPVLATAARLLTDIDISDNL